MSTSNRPSFEQCAIASGLLTEKQIDQARSAVRWSGNEAAGAEAPPSDQQMAARLVEMGWLNAWQANQLLQGRTKFNLGPYWIVDSIGQGGMGQVFTAEHSVIGRVVAIKVLPLSKTTPEAVLSFTREIRALAGLDHDKLVRALDAGYDGNVYYLVTEYVPGCDLRKLVRTQGKLSMSAASGIIYQVAEGLAHAHQQGLIHRDVKPANVLVAPDGEAKLSDLGLAGPLEANEQNDPRFGKIVGTADYVSPDHLKSPWDPTPAWDIYSLGCTLYYAVTSKVPFPGGSTSDKARAHCELQPLDPRRLNSALSDAFVEMLAEMMAKNPANRIQTAEEVMGRLEPWTDQAIRAEAAERASEGRPKRARPSVEPPEIVHPPIKSSAVDVPPAVRAEEGPLHDTLADIPTVAVSGGSDEAGSGVASEPSGAGSWTARGESTGAAEGDPAASQATSILRPLVVLVLAPLLAAVVVALAWSLINGVW